MPCFNFTRCIKFHATTTVKAVIVPSAKSSSNISNLYQTYITVNVNLVNKCFLTSEINVHSPRQ